MTDDEQKAAERELVEDLRKHPEVVEAVKRAAPAWNAAKRQIAGRKIPDSSRPTPSAVPSWLREPGALNSGVDYRRDRKDDEDSTRTRALENIARDGVYTRIAAIAAVVAALAGIVTVVLMAWGMVGD